VDSNIGSETYGDVALLGIGTQLNHARNDLDALIVNTEIKGFHDWRKNQLEWGVKYTRESIRDRVVEWEVIDSAGFSINPPIVNLPKNDQPYSPYAGPLFRIRMSVPLISIQSIDSPVMDSGVENKIGSSSMVVWIRIHNWRLQGGCQWICSDYL
jgi:hypothetical protein